MPSKQAPTLRLPTYDTARNALESVSWNDRGRKWGMLVRYVSRIEGL